MGREASPPSKGSYNNHPNLRVMGDTAVVFPVTSLQWLSLPSPSPLISICKRYIGLSQSRFGFSKIPIIKELSLWCAYISKNDSHGRIRITVRNAYNHTSISSKVSRYSKLNTIASVSRLKFEVGQAKFLLRCEVIWCWKFKIAWEGAYNPAMEENYLD